MRIGEKCVLRGLDSRYSSVTDISHRVGVFRVAARPRRRSPRIAAARWTQSWIAWPDDGATWFLITAR